MKLNNVYKGISAGFPRKIETGVETNAGKFKCLSLKCNFLKMLQAFNCQHNPENDFQYSCRPVLLTSGFLTASSEPLPVLKVAITPQK